MFPVGFYRRRISRFNGNSKKAQSKVNVVEGTNYAENGQKVVRMYGFTVYSNASRLVGKLEFKSKNSQFLSNKEPSKS